jgi:predicted transcriptional regulator
LKNAARATGCVDAVFPGGHTGNTVPTLTVKISKQLRARLAAAAKRRRVSQSELVRQAIEESLREPIPAGESLYDKVKDLIDALPRGGPVTDRSTNKKWMEGYGLDNAQYKERFGRARRPR